MHIRNQMWYGKKQGERAQDTDFEYLEKNMRCKGIHICPLLKAYQNSDPFFTFHRHTVHIQKGEIFTFITSFFTRLRFEGLDPKNSTQTTY